MKKAFGLLVIICICTVNAIYAQKWRQSISVEDVCNNYPGEMTKMISDFNLNYPGLEKVKSAWDLGNLQQACENLLDYYRNSSNAIDLRKTLPPATNRTDAEADTILENVFVVQNIRGQVPWGDDGHRDWYYKGPNNDREWAWLSNRHSQINRVFNVFLKTGNPKYAEYIDLFLRDFIIKSIPYPGVKSSNSVWRGLEVSFRSKVWPVIFYGLLECEYLSPATRLLILFSLPDHAHYNRNFHAQNNWLTMEISALATVATYFPEFKNSDEWLDYSIDTMTESMKGQVYPDGAQTELSSMYHSVSLSNFELFKNICDKANRPVPDFYVQTLEKMHNYIAFTMRPNGTGLLNNDGDLVNNRKTISDVAGIYGRSDWQYIVSNGKEGEEPESGVSYFFPWAGHLISRSGFDKDAHWSFFDIGPWGSGHQHNDKMHISVSAYGHDLLVDAGRFAYTGEVAEKFRNYALGSSSHNLLLIDGKGQNPGPLLAEEPVSEDYFQITDDYDYAKGSFDSFKELEGSCEHTRHFYYKRGGLWIVVDEIKTDRPRKIDALWHWHPDCDVVISGSNVITQNERGNLQIVPLAFENWKITAVKGQEKPEIQGWYSVEYNKYEPNVTSVYTTEIESDTRFVWVLYPSLKTEKEIKAEILSENLNEIKIKVKSNNEKWILRVPQ